MRGLIESVEQAGFGSRKWTCYFPETSAEFVYCDGGITAVPIPLAGIKLQRAQRITESTIHDEPAGDLTIGQCVSSKMPFGPLQKYY